MLQKTYIKHTLAGIFIADVTKISGKSRNMKLISMD